MTAVVRCGTLLGFLVFSPACNDADRLTAPSPTVQPPPPAGVPPSIDPAAGIYLFSGPLSYSVSHYTMASRYVLYESGSFSLQYPSLGGEYVGTYRHENGGTTFSFAADWRWVAIGTVNGDSLEVVYNDYMELSDFENAAYKRSQ